MTTSEPPAADQITTKDSPQTVDQAVARLVDLIQAKGMKVFAVIDQTAEAQGVGLELRPTTLVIFGNPSAGTAVMDACPLAALDLPLKVLIWSERNQTKVSYLAPSALSDRYGLNDDLSRALAGIDPLTDALVSP